MRKTCGHINHTDDDLLLDAGEECGEPADYECKSYSGRPIYRCTYHTVGVFTRYRRLDADERA